MKKLFFTTAAAIAAVIFTGCTELRLAEGIYTTNLSGREDVAMVCNDLIFLRLRNAEDDSMNNGYWDWAGKYEILDEGRISLKMDRKSKRDWQFYYDLTMRGNAIVVDDLRAEKTYTLTWRPAIPRQQQNSNGGFQPMRTDVQPMPAYQ